MLAHAVHEGPLFWFSQSSFISLLWCLAPPFLPQEIMGSTVQQCLQTHHPSRRCTALYCLHLPSTWCVSVIMAHANTHNTPASHCNVASEFPRMISIPHIHNFNLLTFPWSCFSFQLYDFQSFQPALSKTFIFTNNFVPHSPYSLKSYTILAVA